MPTARILVPVANPETASRLVDMAVDVARDRDRELLVCHVVEVPMQLALAQARDELDVEDRRAVVEYALELAREADVPATGRLRFGRDVARGIVDVAATDDVQTILLGWRGRPRRRDVVLGGYIDAVLSDAPCDVLVERIDRDAGEVDSVLVPVAGGPNTAYATEIAGSIARARDARIELVTVVHDREPTTLEAGRDLLTRTSSSLGGVESVEETVLVGDVVETIVERTRAHDVTVVGAAEGGLLERVLVGEIPERIAREAGGEVLVAKRRRSVPDALVERVRDRLRYSSH